MCTICFYVTGFLFVCNFSLVVLRISILSLDVSIDRCKENFPTNRVTRSLHVASNFAFCSVVNVFFFLQPETILDIPYASPMAFYYVIKSTHLIQRITMSKSNFLIYSTSGSPGLQKKESPPEDFCDGWRWGWIGDQSHFSFCSLPHSIPMVWLTWRYLPCLFINRY